MSRVVVINNVTLDGVMQAPGRADEDTRDGFEHGGWAAPYQAMASLMAERSGRTGAMLLGRRTYEDFAGFWPRQSDNPYTEVLNKTRKYVASRTLEEPLPWVNSTLLEGDATEAVAKLREDEEGDLVVLGSGRRLFTDGGAFASLRLIESKTTPTGVVIAIYRPA
jgi:dihydrofolate reductase